MVDHTHNRELFDFHRTPVIDKNNPEYGKNVAKNLLNQFKTTTNNYYRERNDRFEKNRRFARGFQDMKEFLSFMNIDGLKAFVNLDMKPPAIAPKFMEVLIARFEERTERPTVRGIDKISQETRQKRRDDAEFRMNMGGQVQELQQLAGLPLEDPNAYTPENYDDLELHFEIEDRLDEEVKFEKVIKDVMDDNGYPIFKRSALVDLAENGIGIAYVYRDAAGNTKFFRCQPDDCFYGHSNFDDFRDCSLFGVLKKLKVSEVREMYMGKIDEKQLYEMYKSTVQDGRIAIHWADEYRYSLIRPYDDAMIEVFIFNIITTDAKKWVSKVDKYGKTVIDERDKAPQRLGDNKQYIVREHRVVYSGCYSPNADIMLEWKLMENMLKPHYALHEVFTPFVIVMPNNRDMRNMSIIERGETSIRMMSLIHLKIQQLIAKLRPDGYVIDIAGLTNVNIGLGEGETDLTPLELQSIADQTGNFYYNSEATDDGEKRTGPPITPAGMDASVSKLRQLIESYNFYLNRLRDDIGTNEYMEGQGVSPKTGLGVLNNQVAAANRATEFIYRAYLTLIEGVAKRIAVSEWYNIVQGKYQQSHDMSPENYKDFIPDLHIEMAPTDADIAYLEELVNRSLTAQLITMEEAFKVRRIARISVKLAENYLSKYEKRRLKEARETAALNSKNASEQQMASAAQKHQMDLQAKQVEYDGKAKVQKLVNEGDKIKGLSGFVSRILEASIVHKTQVPAEVKPLIDQYMQMMMGLTQVESVETEIDLQMLNMEIQMAQQQMQQGQEVEESGEVEQ